MAKYLLHWRAKDAKIEIEEQNFAHATVFYYKKSERMFGNEIQHQ